MDRSHVWMMCAAGATAVALAATGFALLKSVEPKHPGIYTLNDDTISLSDGVSSDPVVMLDYISEFVVAGDTLVVAHGFGMEREITAVFGGGGRETISKDLAEPRIRGNGTDRVVFGTTTSEAVRLLSGNRDGIIAPDDGDYSISPADDLVMVPGGSSVVAVRDTEVRVHSSDSTEGVVLTEGDALAGATADAVIVRSGETFYSVSLGTGERTGITVVNDGGHLESVSPYAGGTLQTYSEWSDSGMVSMSAYAVSADRAVRLWRQDAPGAIVQVCAHEDGEFAAISYGEDVPSGYLDSYELSYPENLLTAVVRLSDGKTVSTMEGSHPSWCQKSPMWWQHPEAHDHDHAVEGDHEH